MVTAGLDFTRFRIGLDIMGKTVTVQMPEAEIQNVNATIPLTEADSRLGWEPSLDYIAGTWHLKWKLYQLNNLKEQVIPEYRKTI